MANAPSQNATVEEILASIRQAISEDDAMHSGERYQEPRVVERRPAANVSRMFADKEPDAEAPETPSDEDDDTSAEPSPDRDVIELAIEQALHGVRAELENVRPALPRPRLAARLGVEAPVQTPRPAPRVARAAAPIRREAAGPRRALLSPRADAQVAGSFDDLAKAMMAGNSRKLDEVVEELLRPMLKGWLEANLPPMVERLVREEIERVARGHR